MRRSSKRTKPNRKRQSQPWQLQTAKARFSELFRLARTEGPQVVTRQGKEQVVILPAELFARLTKRVRQPNSLVRFFAGLQLFLSQDVERPWRLGLIRICVRGLRTEFWRSIKKWPIAGAC